MRDRLIELLKMQQDYGQKWKDFNRDHAYETITNEQIADYLLENGVIVPPCKVGDTVYVLYNKEVYKTKVFSMVAETEDNKWVYILKCKIFNGISMFKKFLFGKTVFLTREEAERALEVVKNGN